MKNMSLLAHHVTSPDVQQAMDIVQKQVGAPNIAVWAGAVAECPQGAWGLASHILLLGVRGTPAPIEPPRGQKRPDNPWHYIAEAAGGRRSEPIPLTTDQAVEMVRVLNAAAGEQFPAPDLLAITGWRSLWKTIDANRDTTAPTSWIVPLAKTRAIRTDRLWAVWERFRAHNSLRSVA